MKLKCILFEIATVNPPLQASLTEDEIQQLQDTENYYIIMIDNPAAPVMATAEEHEHAMLNRVHFSNAGGIVTVR